MAIVRWDPFPNILTLQDRINRLFEDAFPRKAGLDDDLVCAWRPLVDVFETAEGFVIHADLPGVEKQDVSVEVNDNVLTIKGERRDDGPSRENDYYRRERNCGTFQRSFSLRPLISPEKIKASFKNGVLRVEIPKQEEEKARQVTVNIA
jgi:HSP20 family protein